MWAPEIVKGEYSLVQLIVMVVLRRRLQLVQRQVEVVHSREFARHAAPRLAPLATDPRRRLTRL